jgi:hypothetical protein
MKKLYFLFVLFAGVTASAQVSVSNMRADYVAKKITFTVSWTATPENNKIWLLADYRKIENNAETGSWSRAPIAAASKTAGVGSASTVSGNTQGFWLNTSGSSGSATVEATLNLPGDVAQFNWCAYAFDTPPKATFNPAGGYFLHGTQPFLINGSLSVPASTFGAGTCITSITDATYNPEFSIPVFSAGSITTASATTTPSTAPTGTIANATSASGGDGNITYQWRRSGTSSATLTGSAATYALNTDAANYSTAGAYYFTRYAKDGACNTAFTASDGQYTLTVASIVEPPHHPGTTTYTCGAQTWSAPVWIAACDKSSYLDSDTNPACRSYIWNNTKYFFYNWSYVNANKGSMCQTPWHVPTYNEFMTLRTCLGTTDLEGKYFPENSTWGGSLSGRYTAALGHQSGGQAGIYWASDGLNADGNGRLFQLHISGVWNAYGTALPSLGAQVRCVQ